MEKNMSGRSQVSPRTVWVIGLNVIAISVVLLFLYYARDILILVVIALLLAGATDPVIGWLQKKRLKRGVAVLSFFGVAILILGLLAYSFVPLLDDQIRNLVKSAPELLERFQESSIFKWADREFHVMDRANQTLEKYGGNLAQIFFGALTGLFKGLFDIGTIVVLTVFMLIFGGEVIGEMLEFIKPSRRSNTIEIAQRIQKTVGGYVVGTLLIASIGGVVITLTLLIVGVPYFLPLGVLMTVLGLIPYIGPVIAAVLIVGTTLATSGVVKAIVIAAVFLLYQQVENNLLQPLVQGRTIKMNPLIIVLVILIGTSLAGILGAVLALPIAGAIQVVFQQTVPRK